MRWIEVTLETDGEAAEAVAEVLRRYGHQGVAIEQVGFYIETWEDEVPPPERLAVRAYLPEDERAEAMKAQLEEALYQLNRLYSAVPTKPTYRVIDEQDWAEAWKAHYQPLRIGERILVRPLWIEVESAPEDVVIALDPGMAFGTGTHPSTQLVLEAAEALLPGLQGAQVLDLGCGSGILAIGAAKLGAGHVRAVDTDPAAVRITLENAAANGVQDKISAALGSLELLLNNGEKFDLALVNILAKVIIAMCHQRLGEIIKPNGIAVFGGIIVEQAAEVEAALRGTGLMPYKRRTSGDWVVIEARRRA
ncbi:MAG: 50S ribosomal protein L11 methyltransferase [Candidatus Thermofonsia Clade 1 bacterium]|jgi:ribosomal protein L11 methyltransferase|uniref:Ribosomal protein L11 methyltransferase n=3 Tax=Candidatus Thermofonsia Clade 1 bacterium TaxID=2364210 RepID=A0A2M8PX47_9CHLR|nr:MAG: 50S ribosomal protein L11 methyltransferase [Candidatus Thermofonsia Clade 1 bacterium]